MQKHVVVVFADDEHREVIAKTIEAMRERLREHKEKGQLRNTWYNIHDSSEEEWRKETQEQAHNIALMQILGDNRGKILEDSLSEDTKKRIEEAKQRIFRAMLP